jgi:NADPH-dependent glutamate synthase beta subunit-like oxidoreductase/2,4-dienoyl-CoA reductase-like NADH-dependent reductase (Old Yellow Enzyme family)
MNECQKLFTPYSLKRLLIKNRLMRSAMVLSMATKEGRVTEDLLNIYRKVAEGGVGLCCTGAIAVNPEGRITWHQMGAWSDEHISGLKRLVDTVHAYGNGCVLWGQLCCEGAHDWGYSYGQRDAGLGVDVLTEDYVLTIIEAFADSALRVKEAGFDGVHIHGGHGYLVSQFISPAVNHRTDRWGGSPEKRMRFPLEIYKSIRKKVGDDFPVGIKMNTADYLPDGNWVDDTSRIANKFAEAGFDLIEMSGGMRYMIELREALRKKAGEREYYFRDAIPPFREAVKGTRTALAAVGGIRTPSVMEGILEEGINFISMARPWLSEPDLAKRIKAGDLRSAKCVSTYQLCNLCLTKLGRDSVQCEKFYPGDCRMSCPIGQDNPTFFSLVAQRKFEEALEIVKTDNPLANVLARVCHHPCERICRGKNGEPLALRSLKRFVTDHGLKKGLMVKSKPRICNEGEKVAIVGSGPAGLTCGFYLAQRGYRPTILEKLPMKGGTLAWAVPRYRLPQEILDADITYIESAGVEIKTEMALGKDFSINDLFERGYKAIFLAMGAPLSKRLQIEGETLPGVLQGLDLLNDVNLGKEVRIGNRVVVIGGGNVAIDSAMTALRLGAEKVQLVCLESQEEMPAFKDQIEDAVEEGIRIHAGWGPKRIKGNGKVSGVDFLRCNSVFDKEGRFSPRCDETISTTLDADTIIIAIGQAVDRAPLEGESRIGLTPFGTIEVLGYTLETGYPGVFAGGDVTTGPKSVVDAVAAGKTAAELIDRFLQGRSLIREDPYSPFVKMVRPLAFVDPSETVLTENSLRTVPPKLSAAERRDHFREIVGTLSEEQAVQETKRCLKYDLELEDESAKRLAQMGKAAFVLNP